MVKRAGLISRFAASTALMAAVVVVAAVFFSQLSHRVFFRGAFGSALDEWSVVMAARIGNDPEIAAAAARQHGLGVIVDFGDGTVAFGPDGRATEPEALLASMDGHRRIDALGHAGQRYAFLLDPEESSHDQRAVLLALVVFLLVTIGIVYAVQISQLRPLRLLKDGVDAVSRGNFSTRVPIVRGDEIGQVGRAFNQMTGRIQEMMNDQERLLADVSHELRSPLARIKVALELLPEGPKRAAIVRDVRQMESLTRMLLERERLNSRVGRSHLSLSQQEPIDLVENAREIVDQLAGQPPGVELRAPPGRLELDADPALVRMLLQNLLDNAIKFSLPDSQPVRVALGKADGGIEIVVDDDGPGIPEDQLERVFDPFVKLDPSRGHRRGYGLGLDLCQRIVRAHGGTIELQARPGRGTRVLAVLPGR